MAHEQAAWTRFVDLYAPLVYRWCRQAGVQPEDAEDVGQEVFRAVARKIQDFQHGGPGQTFRGWLRTITRNKVADLMRAYRAKGRGAGWEENYLAQIPAEESAADELSAADENKLVVRRAVELLRAEFEARTWQAFWRVTVDGDCPDDVARELGMTVNAVYLAKSRILRRLRAEFAGLIEIEAGAP
jgi:RNA polymerase sigma-70 factor (ECF subfamily)